MIMIMSYFKLNADTWRFLGI